MTSKPPLLKKWKLPSSSSQSARAWNAQRISSLRVFLSSQTSPLLISLGHRCQHLLQIPLFLKSKPQWYNHHLHFGRVPHHNGNHWSYHSYRGHNRIHNILPIATSIPTSTSTDIETILVTVTSCQDAKCHTTTATTGLTVVTEDTTVYTTYCPLSTAPKSIIVATTVISINTCVEGKSHAATATTGVSVYSHDTTVYTTYFPVVPAAPASSAQAQIASTLSIAPPPSTPPQIASTSSIVLPSGLVSSSAAAPELSSYSVLEASACIMSPIFALLAIALYHLIL